jgi:hypothetical protein
MAYFLGRDVNVYITTEDTNVQITTSDATGTAAINTGSVPTAHTLFAGYLTTAGIASGSVSDVTGVDLSIGAVDEDITYFGFRNITKAEIKKETTVSLTRKKSGNSWDAVYNAGGRWGANSDGLFGGDQEPTTETGYRLYVQLKDGTEWIAVPNACIASHTVSFNADGASEETMEFMSYVTPLVGTSSASVTGTTSTANL